MFILMQTQNMYLIIKQSIFIEKIFFVTNLLASINK